MVPNNFLRCRWLHGLFVQLNSGRSVRDFIAGEFVRWRRVARLLIIAGVLGVPALRANLITLTGVLNNSSGPLGSYAAGTEISFYVLGLPGTLPEPYSADDRLTNYHVDVSVMIGSDHFTTFVGQEGILCTFHQESNGFQLSGNDGFSRAFSVLIYRPASADDDFTPGGPIPDELDLSTYTASEFWIETTTNIPGQYGHIDGVISNFIGTDNLPAVPDSGGTLALLLPTIMAFALVRRFLVRRS